MVNKSDASESEKKEFIDFLGKFWGKYPIKFEQNTYQTRITLDKKKNQLRIPDDENKILAKIDQTIHDYQGEVLNESTIENDGKEPANSPKWGGDAHKAFFYWARENMWIPDSVWSAGDVAQWADEVTRKTYSFVRSIVQTQDGGFAILGSSG